MNFLVFSICLTIMELPSKESVRIKQGPGCFLSSDITVDKYTFNIPNWHPTEIKPIYFGRKRVVLMHYYTVIVIHRDEERFVKFLVYEKYRWNVYCTNDKIIMAFYDDKTNTYQYEIYNLDLKLIATGNSNIMGLFTYKDKVLCITNERTVAELNIDENNNLVFVDGDFEKISNSLYVSLCINDGFEPEKIDPSTYVPDYCKHIYVKWCDERDVYYRNGMICQPYRQSQQINYITDEFYYVAHRQEWQPYSIIYKKYYFNSREYEIMGEASDKFYFINRNEFTTPSILKFSD